MANSTIDLGVITAYGYAKEAGYTGTLAEFEAGLAASANYASNAQASATAAAGSASAAASSASSASGSATAAQSAQTAAEAAQDAAETAQAAAEASAESLDADTIARVDGSYEQMTVGNAEQLVSTVGIEDATPYNFRTSGGSVDIGNREQVNAVVGGTVAWNQLVAPSSGTNRGVSWTFADAVWTFSGTPTASYFNFGGGGYPAGHILIVIASVVANPNNIDFTVGVLNNIDTQTSGKLSKLQKVGSLNTGNFGIAGLTANETVMDGLKIKVQLHDLTAMFGSTIADYIYNLEQTNAGAGVAYFRKLFPKDYYEYNAGELLSVNTSQHKMVGFNAWDEQWDIGSIDGTTGEYTSGSYFRSKNKIRVVSGATYYMKKPNNMNAWLYFYDANGLFVPVSSAGYRILNYSTYLFTVPDDCAYVAFLLDSSYGTTYNHDICINLSWSGSRDGEYEPYEEWVYPLDDSLTLRGIPKLDENGNLYYDGDRYLPDGTVERRYGVVDLGTLTWTYNTSQGRFVANITGAKVPSNNATKANLVCAKYETATTNATIDSSKDKVIGLSVYATLGIKDTGAGADAAAFKASLSGVYLVYELATPTTETATPYTQIQSVDDFGTEEYTDAAVAAGTRDVSVPVGSETYYFANLRDKLQHLPDLAGADGDYIVRQTGTNMTLVPYADVHELPDAPTEDGTYTLQVTVANGTATLSWV